MFRPLVALVVFSSFASSLIAADPIKFAEPLNIGGEMSKINADHAKSQAGVRDRASFEKALANRNEALGQLAAAAEAAKSTDHPALANLYALLQRHDDAVREARAAVKSKETDFAAHATLISALSNLQKLDEATAAFRKLVEQNVAESDTNTYLNSGTTAVTLLAGRLSTAEKFAEAEQLVSDWQARLDKLDIQKEPATSMRERAKTSLASLSSRIAGSKKRAELVGKPHFPIEGATWLNGTPLTPEDLRGKVVLLDFWAVWCGPCIATFPHLREWHDKYGDKGLVIIGVTRRYSYDWDSVANRPKRVEELPAETEDAATLAFLKHHELKHRIAVMPDNAISGKYLVTGIPQAVIIDKQGNIRLIRVGSGEANAKALEENIREALDLKPEAAGKATSAILVTPPAALTLGVSGRSAEKKEDEPAKGLTVILGTWTWDIETNKQQGIEKGADVWWRQATAKEQYLVPLNGAGLVVIEKKAFDEITREDLAALTYSDKKLANDSLAPGTVVALRTNEGNFAKLKVVKYRDTNDFTFPEALLDAKRRELFERIPNRQNYHIEVEWVLYRK